jgi:hypothetical protein
MTPMKPLTPLQCCDHCEFACRAAILIVSGFVMAFLLTYFDRDAEVEA